MGQVIYLDERRAERAQPRPGAPPVFFFDLANPLSYLAAERVERLIGAVDWVPVSSAALGRRRAESLAAGEAALRLRARADMFARALRLPLIWPDRFPAAAPCALRAAAFACEMGAGSSFALAASRLAFCGGFDLEDPETLAEAAAAAAVPLAETLAAAGEAWRDEELGETAALLRAHGVSELPAIRLDGRWYEGESGLLAAAAASGAEPVRLRRPLAPA